MRGPRRAAVAAVGSGALYERTLRHMGEPNARVRSAVCFLAHQLEYPGIWSAVVFNSCNGSPRLEEGGDQLHRHRGESATQQQVAGSLIFDGQSGMGVVGVGRGESNVSCCPMGKCRSESRRPLSTLFSSGRRTQHRDREAKERQDVRSRQASRSAGRQLEAQASLLSRKAGGLADKLLADAQSS